MRRFFSTRDKIFVDVCKKEGQVEAVPFFFLEQKHLSPVLDISENICHWAMALEILKFKISGWGMRLFQCFSWP